MGDLLKGFAIVIGNCINWIIILLALVTIWGFWQTLKKNTALHTDMQEANRKKRGNPRHVKNGFQWNPDTENWGETMDYIHRFDEIELNYSVYAQFVPIFPLLGILGTVAGLIMQIDNVDMMREALAVSMGTTFLGLLAAIILRAFDAIWVSKKLNQTRMDFEHFEMNYQIALDNKNQENE